MNQAGEKEAMNVDQSPLQKLQALTAASTSISNLSASMRAIPSEKDFHFFSNFDEFKVPIQQISRESQSMLGAIGSSAHIWGKEIAFPDDGDLDDGYDWLVNVNDEVFERFDASADEFQKIRKIEEETGKPVMESDDGFQLVYGKKKNKGMSQSVNGLSAGAVSGRDESTVKVATTKAKPKVPFHIPTIRKPQEEFNILVNNSNQPFDHVWLQRSEDGQGPIHPLEKLSVLDFVDKDIGGVEPMTPPSIESTPFKYVEEVKDLKELAAKLRAVNEFAVDLEHNQYRSFQGLTCLMQISTRTEDFVVDTLKLRIHVGPYLREVFKDPTKKKVMHGADRDIVWLQRDFGIYICNMFDTGQASRVLKLERNSLEYLLQHFCGVTANKEYQNGDWRLRPLPDEMVRYAREDTHYLLYIYDLMRIELFSMPKESANADSPLLEVYKRSSELCMLLYEKELLTENSFLYIYGLQGAGLNAQQLAVVAGLCEWRDVVARAEDESTGYILPNRSLLEIAKQMPTTTSKLRRLLKSKHSYIERNLSSVVSIIRHSMLNAASYESAVEHLSQGRLETISEENALVDDGFEADPHDASSAQLRTSTIYGVNVVSRNTEPLDLGCSTIEQVTARKGDSLKHPVENGQVKVGSANSVPVLPSGVLPNFVQSNDTKTNASMFSSSKVTEVTVQVLKKPNRALGSLLGSASSKRKFDTDKKNKEEMKLEQIRSSMNLQFHSFLGGDSQQKPIQEESPRAVEIVGHVETSPAAVANTIVEDVIMLNDETNTEDDTSERKNEQSDKNPQGEDASEDEPMSLSDLSSSFQECFQSGQNRKAGAVEASKESGGFLELKPFDYEAARKQSRYGETEKSGSGVDGGRSSGGRKKGSAGRLEKDDSSSEFPQGRRRQAFPATGNRSATFR